LNRTPELSIIIPALNEEQAIAGLLRSLSHQERISDCEVLVMDGGSTDGTAEMAAAFPFAQVVSCEPGLIQQLNEGVESATASAVWFLHADTTLPDPRTIDSVIGALTDPNVVGGACRFRLRGDDFYYKIVTGFVNTRAKLLTRAYADQGLFVRTKLFRQLGGFRPLRGCADLDLVLRVKAHGAFRLLRAPVETSARTWKRYGKFQTTVWHLREWFSFEWNRLRRRQSPVPNDHAPEGGLDRKVHQDNTGISGN